MATVFLSHASKDDDLASQLEAWLKGEGFDDLFIDHSDIRSGDKWREALRRAKGVARVVLCLVTPRWLASDQCFGEFTAAVYAGQRIIPLLAADPAELDERQARHLAEVMSEFQGGNLAPAIIDGRLDLDATPEIADPLKAGLRAAGALAKIGLDPEAFVIDREIRPSPFPGLQSFGDTDADAAVFYGRSPEIASCLEDLREMRANGARKPYAILGASGSGKSSLLKAGVLPRLRRERGWLVLRTFRPGADPLLNVAEAIAQSLADHGERRAPGTIRDRLRTTWDRAAKEKGFATDAGLSMLRETLEDEVLTPLRARADRPDATVLLPLDQAEELARAEGQGADILCDYLRAALLPPPSTNDAAPVAGAMIALTARTDSFPELQTARRFAGLDARCADIRPVPLYRFSEAIEQPAARYGVEIEPGLVEAMIEDAPGADALPLLAFAMQSLWRQYHEEKRIRKAYYVSIGQLAGLIDRAAERAVRGILPGEERPIEVRLPEERDRLAAKTFVPGLAEVSESGAPIRRVASLDRFDARARELLEPFDQWRLVVTKEGADDGGSTVEVAHEAIFRSWDRFQGWLEPARASLEALRGLETAARVWDRHGRTRAYVDHRGRRLKAAKNLLDHADFATQIGPTERAYLGAASSARVRRGATAGLVVALVACIGFGSWWAAEKGLGVAWRFLALRAGWANAVAPEMVTLPGTLPGTFDMGSTERAEEEPPHPVRVPPFAIGKYEVTFDEWDVCVLDGGCPRRSDEAWGRGSRPVIYVNWDDAQAYLKWLNEVTGETYRLPSEAEWEYAARAGTTTTYALPAPNGSDDIAGKGLANCDGCGSEWDGQSTAPVGSFLANAFGLHDMHGNVWEWVEDCWHDSYGEETGATPRRPDDGNAWEGEDGRRRVLRGGSWNLNPGLLRSAIRLGYFAVNRNLIIGFRVARTLR